MSFQFNCENSKQMCVWSSASSTCQCVTVYFIFYLQKNTKIYFYNKKIYASIFAAFIAALFMERN